MAGRRTRVVSLPLFPAMGVARVLELVSRRPPVTRAMLGVLDHDDRIAGPARRHERVQVGDRPGRDADLGEVGVSGEVGAYLDLYGFMHFGRRHRRLPWGGAHTMPTTILYTQAAATKANR